MVETEYPYLDWTWQELAEKADSEGFEYFWNMWASLDAINDPELLKYVEDFRSAYCSLEGYLEERGGTL